MSFAIHVPCKCVQHGLLNLPPFVEKLELRDGIYDINPVYRDDYELETAYDKWKFCEHDQIALEMDLGQTIISIKPYLREKHKEVFKETVEFLPDFNGYHSTWYDRNKVRDELAQLKEIEPTYRHRFEQFEKLIAAAIANDSWVYF